MTHFSSLDLLLEGRRVVICAGPGGVGKTTTSAAIAVGLARRGAKVAVVTIDPARRLADALGVQELGNEPRRVDPDLFDAAGFALQGELWAMMLDSKRTFDDLIERLAPSARVRDEVLGNRIYAELSTAVAGSQEFTAIAKLYELDAEGDYDVVVLDTPPSRNTLDFLEAPRRISGFFQGRAIRLFLRPAGFGGRLLGAGTGAVFGLMKRATGIDLLEDLSVFFRSLSGLVEGFVERARHVEALLSDEATAFVIVTSPEHGAVEEATFLQRRLSDGDLALAAVVVNRVHQADELSQDDAQALADLLGGELAQRVQAASADALALERRDHQGLERLRASMNGAPVLTLPRFDDDVHDAAGLAQVAQRLYAPPGEGVGARTLG